MLTRLLGSSIVFLGAVTEPRLVVQPAAPLRVYTYSRDSNAGFADERVASFRRELGKHLPFMAIAYGHDDADVKVQLLGHGELTLELGRQGEPDRYLFRLNEDAPRMWVLVRIREFSKAFSLAGGGGRDTSRLAKLIADWLTANRSAIQTRLRP